MPVGTLKNFNPERGFGFLATADGEKDTFCHILEFKAAGLNPRIGDEYQFEIGERDGRPRAVDIRAAEIEGTRSSRWWAGD